MDFIYYVDLVAPRRRHVFHVFAYLADVVDARVRCAVDFLNIQRPSFGDLRTGRTLATGFEIFALFAIGSGTGPMAQGIIYDMTGSYNVSHMISIVLVFIAGTLLWRLGPYTFPAIHEARSVTPEIDAAAERRTAT